MTSAPPPPYSNGSDEKPAQYYQQSVPMAQPIIVGSPLHIAGEYPVTCTCPQCNRQVVTRIQKKAGLLTWLICGGLFIFFLWPCCFIPFCIDALKDTEHFCPNCNAMLGIHKAL